MEAGAGEEGGEPLQRPLVNRSKHILLPVTSSRDLKGAPPPGKEVLHRAPNDGYVLPLKQILTNVVRRGAPLRVPCSGL